MKIGVSRRTNVYSIDTLNLEMTVIPNTNDILSIKKTSHSGICDRNSRNRSGDLRDFPRKNLYRLCGPVVAFTKL
jgi:hypothetical protein